MQIQAAYKFSSACIKVQDVYKFKLLVNAACIYPMYQSSGSKHG